MSRQTAAIIAGFSLSVLLLLGSAGILLLGGESGGRADFSSEVADPLLQEDGHDHRNASQHVLLSLIHI